MSLPFYPHFQMKKDSLNTIIISYMRDHLSPLEKERKMISDRYEQLCNFLSGNCFQSGSYARFTSTTPVNDLDVIWIIPKNFFEGSAVKEVEGKIDPNHLDPSKILSQLAKDLEDNYKKSGQQVRIVPQSHSVGIYFGKTDEEFSIDVVPAIISGERNNYDQDIYWVPQIAKLSKRQRAIRYESKETIDWIKSDPKGYIEDAKELNYQNGNFRKVAKFIRKWRKGCKSKNENFPLKSFHLELIINDIFQESLSIDSLGGITQFFENVENYIVVPTFVDRADPNQFVDAYVADLTQEERRKISLRIVTATTILSELKRVTGDEEALKLIRQLLEGEDTTILKSLVAQAPHQISLGDISHMWELGRAKIIDRGRYPHKVKIRASIWFKGPKDRDVNKHFRRYIVSNTLVPTWHKIKYEITEVDAPKPYKVFWQVVNTGRHAAEKSGLRGEIFEGGSVQWESSLYTGKHWIECFIVNGENVCIARSGRFYVNFINSTFPIALLN